MTLKISESLKLPCGVVIKNRLAKSAMSENMGTSFYPGEEFYHCYKKWGEGGLGLAMTGNIMVDSRHLGEPHNVVIEKNHKNYDKMIAGLKKWASVIQETGMDIWPQINHPGKQTPKFLTPEPVAPSAVALKPPLDKMFNTPRELSEEEILDIIERFGYAAKISKECGFTGVQIHGAHGYLVSQFLSSSSNQRSDRWGGSIEARFNFVKEIYLSMRKNVGDDFPIGIKLNSADFSKGGFTHEEAIFVTKSLSELGIDLIEISGGTYEKTTMMGNDNGKPVKESTRKREAYFIEYAKDIREHIKCPLMVTGGFRTLDFMEETLERDELDLVGIARPVAIDPRWPNQLLDNQRIESKVKPLTSGFKILDTIFPLEIIWYTYQIHRMGHRKDPQPKKGVYPIIFQSAWSIGMQSLRRVRG
ncbi:MAG: NADH:flavin oxidoreductase/NADH oxidase family protein [Oligoflexia bacterium]|nr:NADH:flavin oxidoreductase/NADH oxidase family protein [Oligoflexia bacterium]